ncbi:MAG: hypothetical protein ACF8MJ_03650 [Phycisphaerales bacterium JB050]
MPSSIVRFGTVVLLAAGVLGSLGGCVNKTALGDRPGYQEVQTVEIIAEARKAVQWVETDLDGYNPDSPEAVAARDGVLVQWARVRDRASELQARLDGRTADQSGTGDRKVVAEFYQTTAERAEVLRRETARLLDLWTALNETYRTADLGVGSRPRGN